MAESAYNGWYADDHGNVHFTGQSYSPNHGRNSPGTNYSSPYTSFGGASAPAVEAFPQGENLRWSNQPYAWSEWEQPHGSFEECIDDAGVAGPTLKDSFRLLFATSDDFRQSMALRSLGPQSQRTPIDTFYDEWREEQGEIGERIRELSDTQSTTTILEPLTNRLPKTPSQIPPAVLPQSPSVGPDEAHSKPDTHVSSHGEKNIDVLQGLGGKKTGFDGMCADDLNAVNIPAPRAPTQDLTDTLNRNAHRSREHAQEKLLSQSASATVENETRNHYENLRKLEEHISCSTQPAGDAPDVPWSPNAKDRLSLFVTAENPGQNLGSAQFTEEEVLHILKEGKYGGQNVLALVNAISELGVEDKRVSLGGVTLIDQDTDSVPKHQIFKSHDETSKEAKDFGRRKSLVKEIEDQVPSQSLFQAYVEDASECGPEVEESKTFQPVPRIQAHDEQQRYAGKAHLSDKRKTKTDTERSKHHEIRPEQFPEPPNHTFGILSTEESKRASAPDPERRFYLAEENFTPFRTLASRRRTGSMEVNLASIDEEPSEVASARPASYDETRDKRRRGSRSSSQDPANPQVTHSQIPAMLESNKIMQTHAKELARPPTARGNHAPHLAEPSHLPQGSPEQLGMRGGHSTSSALHQLGPASGPISPIEPLPSPFAPATEKSTSSHPPLRRRPERLDVSVASLYRATTWPAVDLAQGDKDADSGFDRRNERRRERRSADLRTASSSTFDKEDLSSPNTSPASHPHVFTERDIRRSHHVNIDAGISSRRASDAESQRVSFESMQYMAHLNYMRAKYAEQRVDDLEGRNKAMKSRTRTTEKAAETWAREARTSSESAKVLEVKVQALEEEKRRLRAEIEGLRSTAQTSSRMQESRRGGDRDDGTRRRFERSKRREHRAVSDKSRRPGSEAEGHILKGLEDEIHALKREIKTLKLENVELVTEGKEKERVGNVWKERCRTWEKRFAAEGRAAKVGGFVGRRHRPHPRAPSHGNLAVALLSRRPEPLNQIRDKIRSSAPGAVAEAFPSDTSPDSLSQAFSHIRSHQSFRDLKLKLAIYHVKHSSKKPFMTETYKEFTESLDTYVGGAFNFAQEALKMFFEQHGESTLADGAEKKGTIIFTGTLGALRCSAEFAAYGAGRAGVRQLAQTLAREMSGKGVHVVHTIANGGIADEDGEDQRTGNKMSAEAVGKTYLWLAQQEPCLWTHELDMRPAQEKF